MKEWKNGYSDGSGKGTITFDGEGVLRVHWGCDCCDSFSEYDPSEKDKKLVLFADALVKLLNRSKICPPKKEVEKN